MSFLRGRRLASAPARRVVFSGCIALALAGCGSRAATSSTSDAPAIPSVAARAETQASIPTVTASDVSPLATKAFGIMSQQYAYLTDGATHRTFADCNGKRSNTYSSCNEVYGRKDTSMTRSKTIESKASGTYASSISYDTSPGTVAYSADSTVDGTSTEAEGPGSTSQANSAFFDTLTAHATTLVPGTQVSSGVALIVSPSTTAITYDSSGGTLNFVGPAPSDQYGARNFQVYGTCGALGDPGSFGYSNSSTTDTGTLTVANAQVNPIEFSGGASVQACLTPLGCTGSFHEQLAGTAKSEITSVPAGVTYATASGAR